MKLLMPLNNNYGILCCLVEDGILFKLVKKKKFFQRGIKKFREYVYINTKYIVLEFSSMKSIEEEVKRLTKELLITLEIEGVVFKQKSNHKHIFENIVNGLVENFKKIS